jgi:hypothetical protein
MSAEGKIPDLRKPDGGTVTKKKAALKILKGKVSDEHAHAHRVVDQVEWESLDNQYDLIFDTPPFPEEPAWPFNESPDKQPATIVVPAKGMGIRGPFTVRANARKRILPNGDPIGYGYRVDPPHPTHPVPEIVPDP